ncbi:MAG: 2-(1,2-epoxy-1,2-dihydrophenyl)acetyl-CoA isomerase, partial [Xanthobacteraceae bacterium]
MWRPRFRDARAGRRTGRTRAESRKDAMQFKHATLDFDGPVAVLTLDHQEVMNAVSVDMLGGLGEALDAIEDRRAEVRCLVIT